MSNLLLNLRIGTIHFQIHRDRPWVSIGHNPYWSGAKKWRPFVQFH